MQRPRRLLQQVRYVETDQTRGLVLRLTRPGVAAGPLRWECAPDRGEYVWTSNWRFVWAEDHLSEVAEGASSWELSRFVLRKKFKLLKDLHEHLRSVLDGRLERLRKCLDDDPEAGWISNLWPRLLLGPRDVSEEEKDPDEQLPQHEQPCLRALRMLAALNSPGLARLVQEPLADAQLILEQDPKHYVMIWNDPKLSCSRQLRQLEPLVGENGRPGLFVIGDGEKGQAAPQKIESHRRSDITRSSDGGRDKQVRRFTEPRSLRLVYWFPLRRFENVLDEEDKDWPRDAGPVLDRRLQELIESLVKVVEGAAA